MLFFLIFVLLEALTFISDPILEKITKLPKKSVLFLTQSFVVAIMAFVPLLGIPFVNLKGGQVVLVGEPIYGFFFVSSIFFIISFYMAIRKKK